MSVPNIAPMNTPSSFKQRVTSDMIPGRSFIQCILNTTTKKKRTMKKNVLYFYVLLFIKHIFQQAFKNMYKIINYIHNFCFPKYPIMYYGDL